MLRAPFIRVTLITPREFGNERVRWAGGARRRQIAAAPAGVLVERRIFLRVLFIPRFYARVSLLSFPRVPNTAGILNSSSYGNAAFVLARYSGIYLFRILWVITDSITIVSLLFIVFSIYQEFVDSPVATSPNTNSFPTVDLNFTGTNV